VVTPRLCVGGGRADVVNGSIACLAKNNGLVFHIDHLSPDKRKIEKGRKRGNERRSISRFKHIENRRRKNQNGTKEIQNKAIQHLVSQRERERRDQLDVGVLACLEGFKRVLGVLCDGEGDTRNKGLLCACTNVHARLQ
jgi:hypothetical protein